MLTACNAKGTMTFVQADNTQKPGGGLGSTLGVQRFSDQDLQALEEKRCLLGKPPIKEQLAALRFMQGFRNGRECLDCGRSGC